VSDYKDAVDEIYNESNNFVLIGLTGRTGSGCSTAAKILQSEEAKIPKESEIYSAVNDKRKFEIVRGYVRSNWQPFTCIQVRTVLTSFLLELNFDEFCELVSNSLELSYADAQNRLRDFKEEYEVKHNKIVTLKAMPEEDEDEKNRKAEVAWDVYFDLLPEFAERIKDVLQRSIEVSAYVKLYQIIGDNIRASGRANLSDFNPQKLYALPKVINKIIKVINRKKEKAFIVIDAIRNPYEAMFFKQRYANFYLISINTPNDERLNHLRKSHKFSESQIINLDTKEYPKSLKGEAVFVSQNIQKCIEISDVHIHNPKRENYNNTELASQLAWYIALILHPGLVTPTSIERCMQLAYSVKLSSGCISRQVGAVVTDKNYSVKAVGWNNVPEGQIPCLLRSANELLDGGQEDIYSSYERNDEDFHAVLEESFGSLDKKSLCGRNVSYCFKELQNEVDNEKNQVHTRSLHAEENAFLQITKYGGGAIEGGKLFTTASPCELCSKKAYQLGIKDIVFIDPYPGISKDHILDAGEKNPSLILFRGALGRAYHQLYQPLIAYKDELKLVTGYTVSGSKKRNKKELRFKQLEEENRRLKQLLKSREKE